MSDTKHVVVTREGLQRMKEELEYKETTEKMKVAEQLKVAISYGDLSENAEYDAAKEAQGMLEMKISKLKDLIATARIIDESKLNTDTVQLLNKVTIRNTANGMTMTYWIVTESEANLREKKIASNTPIAAALLGHKVGDKVQVTIPAGTVNFEIMKIEI